MALLDDIREACARVAASARSVAIEEAALDAYAAGLPSPPEAPEEPSEGGIARVLTLDAVNFGSGWFPTLVKPPGLSGFRTVEARIAARFASAGPWSPADLQTLSAEEVAAVLGQAPDHELMGLYAVALNDLGAHVERAGGWEAVVQGAAGSAERLVEQLADWPSFRDISVYDGRAVPFFKRAQIAAADLGRAGAAGFGDLHRLTLFADNLVPHVLRLDGVLRLDPGLVARIDAHELLAHGSPEEVEIRACALHAVEAIAARRPDLTAADVDLVLWSRGSGPRYKARPRHRARCTAY